MFSATTRTMQSTVFALMATMPGLVADTEPEAGLAVAPVVAPALEVVAVVAPPPVSTPAPPATAAPDDDGDEALLLVAGDPPLIERRGDEIVVNFAQDDGTRLVDFLRAAQPQLGVPISYHPMEVGDTHVHFIGTPSLPAASFRDFFDDLLRRYDFMSYDASASHGDHIVVERLGSSPRHGGRGQLTTQFVDPSALETQPSRRTALYETSFALAHCDARSLMAAFQPVVDTTYEGLRNVEASNSLIVTARSMAKLRRVADLIAVVDVPGDAMQASLRSRVALLENTVEALMTRLAELESAR